ncbi:MAG: LysR family transcriptional regulator [Chromatiales bacterium]|nr:LysR family transcriptional regulator [Chromatiales bacterium]
MEFASLRAFVQVAREGSFSNAAQGLYLTQPAVSKRVAALEQELSVRLFDRVGRQVFLTEAGRQLLPRAEQILQEMADIRRGLSNLSGEISGRLVMGTSHHIGLHRLPSVLRNFSDAFPNAELDIRFMESEKACQAVEHGELEMAVVTLPLNPIEALDALKIWHDPLCFAVGPDHQLARQPSTSLKQLVNHPAVLPTKGTYTRTLLEQSINDRQLTVNCTLATDYLETLKMMTSIGLGWSLLPEILLEEGQILKLEVPELQLSRSLGIVTHRKRTLSNVANAMRQQLLAQSDRQVS